MNFTQPTFSDIIDRHPMVYNVLYGQYSGLLIAGIIIVGLMAYIGAIVEYRNDYAISPRKNLWMWIAVLLMTTISAVCIVLSVSDEATAWVIEHDVIGSQK